VNEQQLRIAMTWWPHEGVLLVVASGECDLAEAPKLEKALCRFAGMGSDHEVQLDLGGLAHLDSSGIAVLMRASNVLGKAGCKLVLVSPPPAVRQVLALADADNWLVIRDSEGLLISGPT
jgi:anti-anti-sigma factor